jgi:hypothetical protein
MDQPATIFLINLTTDVLFIGLQNGKLKVPLFSENFLCRPAPLLLLQVVGVLGVAAGPGSHVTVGRLGQVVGHLGGGSDAVRRRKTGSAVLDRNLLERKE